MNISNCHYFKCRCWKPNQRSWWLENWALFWIHLNMSLFKCNLICHSCILIMLNEEINFHKLINNFIFARDCDKLGILLTCDWRVIVCVLNNEFSNWGMNWQFLIKIKSCKCVSTTHYHVQSNGIFNNLSMEMQCFSFRQILCNNTRRHEVISLSGWTFDLQII
jgi:hypothetical protein